MYCALFDTHVDKIKRISLALDSTGNIVHHSAASLVICMLVTGSMTPDRFVFDPILILCIQHWFVLLHDYHKLLYMVIQVLLEIWFEWTVLSNFEHYASNHWTAEVAASWMLLAHWMWLVSASLSLVTMKSKTRELKKFDEEELSKNESDIDATKNTRMSPNDRQSLGKKDVWEEDAQDLEA